MQAGDPCPESSILCKEARAIALDFSDPMGNSPGRRFVAVEDATFRFGSIIYTSRTARCCRAQRKLLWLPTCFQTKPEGSPLSHTIPSLHVSYARITYSGRRAQYV